MLAIDLRYAYCLTYNNDGLAGVLLGGVLVGGVRDDLGNGDRLCCVSDAVLPCMRSVVLRGGWSSTS